jgi:hypothetical protein
MDLNPQTPEWTSAEGPYEIADYCVAQKANVLLLLNSWLDSREETEEDKDWQSLNYWAARTRPLWAENSTDTASDHETVFIVCNRAGEEKGKHIAFSSYLGAANLHVEQTRNSLDHLPFLVSHRDPDTPNSWTQWTELKNLYAYGIYSHKTDALIEKYQTMLLYKIYPSNKANHINGIYLSSPLLALTFTGRCSAPQMFDNILHIFQISII